MEKMSEKAVDTAKVGLSLLTMIGTANLTMDALGFLPKRVALGAKIAQSVASAAICGLMSESASAYMERVVDKAANMWNGMVERAKANDDPEEDPKQKAEG